MQVVLSSMFLSYRKFQCLGGYVYSMIINGNFHFILGFMIYVFHSIYLQHVHWNERKKLQRSFLYQCYFHRVIRKSTLETQPIHVCQ